MKSRNIDSLIAVLPTGEENAISGDHLISALNISSVRQLQKLIAKARLSGTIICSSYSGGYFLPSTRAEIECFYHTTKKKALSTLTILNSARIALNEVDGQQELNEVI